MRQDRVAGLLIPIPISEWHKLPRCYLTYETVNRRLLEWCGDEVLRAVLLGLSNLLRDSREPNNVRNACNRAEFLPGRRAMVQQWADMAVAAAQGADVVPIERRARA